MTTKELIEMLQKEDPSGEAHIRLGDGVPMWAELKEGYWDGPYSYIDKDGNYTYTTKGMKVDLYCVDVWGFVERNYRRGVKWEDIEKKFKFDLSYSIKEQRDERSNSILKTAKQAYDDIKEIEESLYTRALEEMIKNSDNGWTWFQNKEVDLGQSPNLHVYYTWKIYDKDGKEQSSNVHNTESILISGLWEKLDNNKKPGYYQWIKK